MTSPWSCLSSERSTMRPPGTEHARALFERALRMLGVRERVKDDHRVERRRAERELVPRRPPARGRGDTRRAAPSRRRSFAGSCRCRRASGNRARGRPRPRRRRTPRRGRPRAEAARRCPWRATPRCGPASSGGASRLRTTQGARRAARRRARAGGADRPSSVGSAELVASSRTALAVPGSVLTARA